MKVFLCFRRDERGRPRLFHAYDEVEVDEVEGNTPPGLLAALDTIEFRSGETWGMACIDTDDPILRGADSLELLDLDLLLPMEPIEGEQT